MFDSIWLDIAIGLITVFLVFSLVTSGVRELFATMLAARSANLWNQLSMLLDDEPSDTRPPNQGVRTEGTGPSSVISRVSAVAYRLLGQVQNLLVRIGWREADTPQALPTQVTEIVGRVSGGSMKVWEALYVHPFIRHLDLTNKGAPRTRLSHIPPRDFARTLVDLFLTAGDTLDPVFGPLATGAERAQLTTIEAQLAAARSGVEGLATPAPATAVSAEFGALKAAVQALSATEQASFAEKAWEAATLAGLTDVEKPVAEKAWAGQSLSTPEEEIRARISAAITKPPTFRTPAQLVRDAEESCIRFAKDEFGKITNGAAKLLPEAKRNSGLGRIALRLVGEAAQSTEDQIVKLRTSLSSWFDSNMTALSASYRTRTRVWSFVIGLLVAISFNVDSIGVGRELYGNENTRAALVSLGAQLVDDLDLETTKGACAKAKAPGANADLETQIETQRKCIGERVAQVTETGLPVGWDGFGEEPFGQRAAGWVITAAALSFGAPFWYDLLKRASGLRRKEEKD